MTRSCARALICAALAASPSALAQPQSAGSYADLQRLAVQTHTSMARAIQPFQTRNDGDVLFAASTGEVENPELHFDDLAVVAGELAWDAVLASYDPH